MQSEQLISPAWLRKQLEQCREMAASIKAKLTDVHRLAKPPAALSFSLCLVGLLDEQIKRDLENFPPQEPPPLVHCDETGDGRFAVWVGRVFCGYEPNQQRAQDRITALRAEIDGEVQRVNESKSRTTLEDCKKEVSAFAGRGQYPQDKGAQGKAQYPDSREYHKDRL